MSWLETYRGTVYRWEVDNVDHFTVAFYFARFEDATLAMLHAFGIDPGALDEAGTAFATLGCHVRYLRELRVGDVFHVESGVWDVGDDQLGLVHRVFDSSDGALCTTVEQRAAMVRVRDRAPVGLPAAVRAAAERAKVEWTPAPEPEPAPFQGDGFRDTARDAIKPSEVDTQGFAAFPAYVHRFSAAIAQILAAFGVSPAWLTETQRGFSTFEFRLGFSGALRSGDLVRVESALLQMGNTSMRFLHRLTDLRTGVEAARLEQAGVLLDLKARKAVPMAPEMRERAMSMLARPAATR